MGKKWRVIGGVLGFTVGGVIAVSGTVNIQAAFIALMAGGAIGLLIGAFASFISKNPQLFGVRRKSALRVLRMQYSVMGLMIVVTLVCVVMGGVIARANYLKHWEDYHDREAERMVSEVAAEQGWTRQLVNERVEYPTLRRTSLWYIGQHRRLAHEYREAMYRPWIVVVEYPSQWPGPKPVQERLPLKHPPQVHLSSDP